MKKKFIRLTVLVLTLAMCLCACGENRVTVYEITAEIAWDVYPSEKAPAHAVRSGDTHYMLMGVYNGNEFSLAVKKDGYEKEVYSAYGVSIWFMEAEGEYAVWCEMTSDARVFKLYDGNNGEVSEIFSASLDAGYQNANVGIYKGSVYFAYTDYTEKSAYIMRYDIGSKTLEKFCTLDFSGETSCTSLSVDRGMLTVSSGTEGNVSLITFDLENGGEAETKKLDGSVDFVYGCAYDTVTGDIAVYYRDKDKKENIGVVKNGKRAPEVLFTFGENVYAYRDTVEIYGGHVYWVNQANVTGFVSDHYRFIDYNYIDGITEEYIRTFSFSLTDDGVVLLSFNAREYDAIYLSEIYLGGQKK